MILEKKDSLNITEEVIALQRCFSIDEQKEFGLLRNTYHSAIREISTKLEIMDDEFQVRYDYNPIHHMESRLKSPASLFEKMARQGLEINLENVRKITDIAGIRVMCHYVGDVYRVADLLLKQDDVKLIRRSDYIENPKESGYRSLHLVVEIPVFLSDTTEHVPVEIQFRTIAMDTWASLEHELKYKRSGPILPSTVDELKACASALAEVDRRMEKIHKEK